MGSDLRARASPPWDRKIPRLRPAGFQSAALPSELRPRVLASGISESNRVCPGPKPGGLPSPSFPLVTPRVLNPPPVLRTAGLPRLRFPVHPTPGVVRRLRSCAPAGRLQTGPVGVRGFEPRTSSSRTMRASQAALYPDGVANYSGPGAGDSRRVMPVALRRAAVPRFATWRRSDSNRRHAACGAAALPD
jgi:hypothetical protein